MQRYRFVFAPRWLLLTAAGLVVMVVCGLLSQWQWDRAVMRAAANEVIETSRVAAPVDEVLPAGAALDDADRWTLVEATGVYDAEHEIVWLSLARAEAGRGTVRRRVGLERESLRPVSLRAYDASGELLSDVSLAGWSADAPRRVVIRRPAEGYVAEFSLDKVELNKTVPEKAFEPRPAVGYRTVEVGG